MSKAVCVACRHQIDAAARLCPYCGADPQSGQKVDTHAILREVFQPREISTTEGVLQFARQRQGVVIVTAVFVAFIVLAALHQFASKRNQSDVSAAAAVPLTEVTDLTSQPSETRQLPMPEMQFQFDGHPQTMRTFVTEPGAVTPPDVLAAQQAEKQAAQAAAAPQPGAAQPAQSPAAAPKPPASAPQPR
jgi:hypothetical protein